MVRCFSSASVSSRKLTNMSFIVSPLSHIIYVFLCPMAKGGCFMWLIFLCYCHIQIWVVRRKIAPKINYTIMRTLLLPRPWDHPALGVGAGSQTVAEQWGSTPRCPIGRSSMTNPSHRSYWPSPCHGSDLRASCNFYVVPISLQISLSNEKVCYYNVLGVGTWYSFKSYLAVNWLIDH